MNAVSLGEKGWLIRRDGPPVTRFQVFGERSSGTNFVKRLVGRNTALTPREDLGWKHGFAQMTAIPADFAVICVVRDARAWALSMHAKPWHCPPAMQALDFPAFLRAEWTTVADRKRYFPQVADLGGEGRPLQQDRHPLTGLPFANLFALRRAKLAALSSFANRGCALVLARLEAVQAAPDAFLADLCAGFGTEPPVQPLKPVVKRLGAKFLPAIDPRPATPTAFSDADLDFLRASVDDAQEAALGYVY
ncbi:hypothetical protein KUH32_14745 [Thalassococcus sp. CAU 1522]|uniref:Sulfotransferase family protein n=1 Tax=Thalassococcus arenae TaxID=2851652 RepID=A0ABS6NBU3_9RHOB|nr:hypothetical protein [Thalassococcus arenae]MBV2361020.1 hypothetical protein [Thalassococcus arenae]